MPAENTKRTTRAFIIGLAVGILIYVVVVELLWPLVAGE